MGKNMYMFVALQLASLRNRTAGRLRTAGNAQSRATFFRHSAVLSLPVVLLGKLAIIIM